MSQRFNIYRMVSNTIDVPDEIANTWCNTNGHYEDAQGNELNISIIKFLDEKGWPSLSEGTILTSEFEVSHLGDSKTWEYKTFR